MGEYRWLYRELQMCYIIILIVNFSQAFNIMIYFRISAPGHGREFVDGINDTDKRFILKLMAKVQLHGSQRFDAQMAMYTSAQTADVSLAQ